MNSYLKSLMCVLPFALLAGCGAEPAVVEEPQEEEVKLLTPKDVVTEFVTALAGGNCKKAKEMATGVAVDMVQGNIAGGCMSYKTTIKSVDCVESGTTAECGCTEMRDGMEYVFNYKLEKVGEDWKVTEYGKDDGLDESDSTAVISDSTIVEE